MPKRQRLRPPQTVARELYLKSGNACAFPKCDSRLVDKRGIFIGEIAHIVGASEDGPRNDRNFDAEDARAAANLMLLCPSHHTRIDRDEGTWTISVLKQMKASHEALFTNFISEMIDGATRIRDRTKDSPGIPARTLDAWLNGWDEGPGDLSSEELERERARFDAMFDAITKLSKEARDLLVVVVSESLDREPAGHGVPYIELDILQRKTYLGVEEFRGLLNELTVQGVVSVEYECEFDQLPYVELRMPGAIDNELWLWVAAFLRATGSDFTEFFADLRFDLLDSTEPGGDD